MVTEASNKKQDAAVGAGKSQGSWQDSQGNGKERTIIT